MNEEHGWWVYILRCADGTLYTGMAADVDKRLRTHNGGLGAKYTRSRLPVALVYREACESRSAALRREAAIKRLSRSEKLKLVHSGKTSDNPGKSGDKESNSATDAL